MTILIAGSGCAKLIFLPRQFCAPFLFTLHYYCTYAHKTIWLYYSTYFLPPQTYLLMLQSTNSRFQNYELLIQNLRTFDTKPMNYQSFLLQIADFKITNYQSFLIQTPDSNITNYLPILFVSVDKIKRSQVMLGER